MDQLIRIGARRDPWNKGKLVGQKTPLRLKDIWAIRIRLQLGERRRELALFNLAVDSKLRSCDLVKLRVRNVVHGERVAARAIVNRRRSDPCSSRSPSKRAQRCWLGFSTKPSKARIFCFPVACGGRLICRHANAPESCTRGWARSASIQRVKHAYAAAHQSVIDLPPHEEPSGGPAPPRPQQAGKYGAISGDRG